LSGRLIEWRNLPEQDWVDAVRHVRDRVNAANNAYIAELTKRAAHDGKVSDKARERQATIEAAQRRLDDALGRNPL
jgi:hypothetical protein